MSQRQSRSWSVHSSGNGISGLPHQWDSTPCGRAIPARLRDFVAALRHPLVIESKANSKWPSGLMFCYFLQPSPPIGFRSLRSRYPCPPAAGLQNVIKNSAQASLALFFLPFCGGEGIRTPDTVTRTPVFEAGSFNHSDTPPYFGVAKLRKNINFAKRPA